MSFAFLGDKPLSHCVSAAGEAVLRTTSQSLLRNASSPGRGATGESVAAVLDERSFHFQKQLGSAVSIHDYLPCASLVRAQSRSRCPFGQGPAPCARLGLREQQGWPGLPRAPLPGELSSVSETERLYRAAPFKQRFILPRSRSRRRARRRRWPRPAGRSRRSWSCRQSGAPASCGACTP